MPDLISIVMPAYNHEKYIHETINSIINQTYKNIELIVINDGSSDNTWQKILELKDKCEKRFTNLIMENQENQGARYTFNKGCEAAKGKYIFIIASDDIAKPDAIETLHSFLSSHPQYGLAVGDNDIIDNNSQRVFWDKKKNNVYKEKNAAYKTFGGFLKHSRKNIDFESDDFGTYQSLLKGNYIPNGYLVKKDILEKTGGYVKEAPLEDWYIMLQISKISRLKYIDKVLFSYRWHGANSIKQTQKMRAYIKSTFDYEIHKALSSNDKDIAAKMAYFLENSKKRVYLRIGTIIEVYRVKNPSYKQYTLKLFGKRFDKRIT